jgi:membrane-associated phospholipid phosphatase
VEGFWFNLTQINLVFQQMGEWLFFPMRIFSFLGDEMFYLFIMPAIFWCYDSQFGLQIGMLLMLSNGFSTTFKFLFHSPRPFWVSNDVKALVKETSFGIPSGHSLNAMALWGYFTSASKNKWIRVIFISIIFFIGLSRLYLGVHFITDVLSGWIIGLLILLIYIYTYKKLSIKISSYNAFKKWILIILSTALIVFLPIIIRQINHSWQMNQVYLENINLAFPDEKFDPYSIDGAITAGGAWFGLLVGVLITYKTIPLGRIKANSKQLIMRFVIGLIGVVIFYGGLKAIFPENIKIISEVLRFIRYGLVGLWITGGAPFFFKKFGLYQKL